MIKIDNKDLEIRGKGVDIVQEFCSIIQGIRVEQPEMLAGVMMAWTDIMAKDLEHVNIDLAKMIGNVAADWIELNEVE